MYSSSFYLPATRAMIVPRLFIINSRVAAPDDSTGKYGFSHRTLPFWDEET
jgi:hypothetical protein